MELLLISNHIQQHEVDEYKSRRMVWCAVCLSDEARVREVDPP